MTVTTFKPQTFKPETAAQAAEAVRWAAVAGSLSTRGAGGTGGQATRAEVEAELSA